ncbi:MAG: hypothetical protein ACQEQN_08385, partial [Thermodesulfobacteriota bacterium]
MSSISFVYERFITAVLKCQQIVAGRIEEKPMKEQEKVRKNKKGRTRGKGQFPFVGVGVLPLATVSDWDRSMARFASLIPKIAM